MIMNIRKVVFVIVILPLLAFSSMHKYYVSITKINYVKEEQSFQVTTRIFIDDFEKLLRARYDETLILNSGQTEEQIDVYIKTYLRMKLQIKINDNKQVLNFIGKAYEDDEVVCYLEIENVAEVNQFEVKNEVLFDLFQQQKNIVRTYINSKNKTFVLTPNNKKGLLSF